MTTPPSLPPAMDPEAQRVAPTVWADDAQKLMRAALLIEAEAQTWADGWAVRGVWHDDKDSQWAHVRFQKLLTASQDLRSIASRRIKTPRPTP